MVHLTREVLKYLRRRSVSENRTTNGCHQNEEDIFYAAHHKNERDNRKKQTEIHWKRKTLPKKLKMTLEDMMELDIDRKDLEEKSLNYNLLKEYKTIVQITETNRKEMVISEAE